MRIWSLSPAYLDTKGLVALWRETLLAQSVIHKLAGGYTNHPQLYRFKKSENPLGALGFYLNEIVKEAKNRNYNFDNQKIQLIDNNVKIPVTKGQVEYEFEHLKNKLKLRDPARLENVQNIKDIVLNPLFYLIDGDIESWEKV